MDTIAPNAVIKGAIRYDAVDKCVAGYIRYIGSEASATITIAATTGDITLKHGAASSEVADTTIATNGIIDLSGEAATFKVLATVINASPNWEWIWGCALPDDPTEASGTSKIINNVAETSTNITTTGYAILIDTSATLYHSVGVTKQGPSSEPHGSDANVYHEITLMQVTTTYGTGTSTVYVYEVDDVNQSQTELFTIAGGASTAEMKHPTTGNHYPFVTTEGKRFVVKVINSAAMTAADMTVYFETYVYGSAVRKSKLMSAQ